jgi:predicted alpha/beta superfamily hydrolase
VNPIKPAERGAMPRRPNPHMNHPRYNPELRQIIVQVDVPRDTPADAQLFVAGDFNAWQPSNPMFRLTPMGVASFRLAFQIDAAEARFKITRGSWESVECNPDGSPGTNHDWLADEIDEPVSVSVESWTDLNPAARQYLPRHTITGDVRCVKDVYSPQLENYRDLLVYLPPIYRHDPQRRYPVLYAQDGQNLFDDATAFADEWGVDETCERLANEEQIEFIIVAIPNYGRRRLFEYSPWHDGFANAGGEGDAYTRFVIETVMPAVNSRFRTAQHVSATGIFGSSMGGLIALYAGLTRPDVFGCVGAMSPSLLFAGGKIIEHVENAPSSRPCVYLDCGSDEYPGLRSRSRRLVDATERMAHLLTARGAQVKLVIAPGGRHQEADWARRLPDALRFLYHHMRA